MELTLFANFVLPPPPIDRIALIDTSFSVHLPVHQWQSFFIRKSQLPKGIDSSAGGRPLVTCLWMECSVSLFSVCPIEVEEEEDDITSSHTVWAKAVVEDGIRWSGELSDGWNEWHLPHEGRKMEKKDKTLVNDGN